MRTAADQRRGMDTAVVFVGAPPVQRELDGSRVRALRRGGNSGRRKKLTEGIKDGIVGPTRPCSAPPTSRGGSIE